MRPQAQNKVLTIFSGGMYVGKTPFGPRPAKQISRWTIERRIVPALLGSILRGEKYGTFRAAVLGSRRSERRLFY